MFQVSPLSSMDRWILSRLYSTVAQCEQGFEEYELHTVTSALYSFWVHSLCDVYMVRRGTQLGVMGLCITSKLLIIQSKKGRLICS